MASINGYAPDPIPREYGSSATDIGEDLFSTSVGNIILDEIDVDFHLENLFDEKGDSLSWSPNTDWDGNALLTALDSRQKPILDLDDDEDEGIDLESWKDKRKEQWETTDTINWLLSAGIELGQPFGEMSPDLAMPGRELISLSKKDFISYDPRFGAKLYKLLHKKDHSRNIPSPSSDKASGLLSDRETFVDSGNDSSDGGSVLTGLDPTIKLRSSRPLLPDFIKVLLSNPQKYWNLIRWENYEEKTFRFVRNDDVAKLWGELNGKKNMTYEKLTRAMRYYYDKSKGRDGTDDGIFASCSERLVYKFGKKAIGLETSNPNFEFKDSLR